jgi:hypothetical protein
MFFPGTSHRYKFTFVLGQVRMGMLKGFLIDLMTIKKAKLY